VTPRHRVSDDALARRAAAGDDAAFATLFERHGSALYRYCRSIVGHDQDAQDVVQSTMEHALASLRRTPLTAPLRPWLFRIAHNESISLLRRRRPVDDLEQQFDLAGATIERQLEDRQRMAALLADLQELPERQRSALVMRELSGLSHEEIAVALAVSVSATKQAIFDARKGLQAAKAGRAMECEPVQRAISDGDGRVLRARPMRAHVRSCSSCSAMRDAIGAREKELASLFPPLPLLGGMALLERILQSGAGAAGGGGAAATAGGGGAATTVVAAKVGGLAAGMATSGKALVVAALVVATAGTVAVVTQPHSTSPAPIVAASGPLAQLQPVSGGVLRTGAMTFVSSTGSTTGTSNPAGSPAGQAGSALPGATSPSAGPIPTTTGSKPAVNSAAEPNPVSSTLGTATKTAGGGVKQGSGSAEQAVDNVKQTVSEKAGKAKQTVDDTTGKVKHTADETVDKVEQTADQTAGKTKTTVDDTVGKAKKLLPKLP
jgi:RNA polymerase sigma factor (sigma-70 family)